MLFLAFWVLAAAVVLGIVLALLHIRPGRGAAPWQLGAIHGIIGASGLALLVLALRGPPRGTIYGIAPFGVVSAVLFALALLAGLLVLRHLRRGRHPVTLIGAHAMIAISAFVVLAAYVAIG